MKITFFVKPKVKSAALYYRAANKPEKALNLDNQINELLCYTSGMELDNFTLYADLGYSGSSLDRPALNSLRKAVERGFEKGGIDKIIVTDIPRIARDFILIQEFLSWASEYGVRVISVSEGLLNPPHREGGESG